MSTHSHLFRQVVYSPEDPANPCTNYPNERFRSYDDCDEDFIRRSLPHGLGIDLQDSYGATGLTDIFERIL